MNILDIHSNFWFYWFVFCGIIMGRYFIMAGGSYWLIQSFVYKKLPTFESSDQQRRELEISKDIRLSTLSAILFALSAAAFMMFYDWGITKVYTDWKIQDLGYLTFSYITVLLLQDTYFYFLHRLFHLPSLFRWLHQGHHQSKVPSPWTSFAFDPMEAVVQASFLLSITFIIPLHVGVLIAILLTMTIWAMGNHIGFQVIPYSKISRWCGKWCIGSTHHLIHHRRYTRHYGLYFTFWDKVLGTQDIKYELQRLDSSA